MPLYSYACDDCGPFEGWSAMSEADQPACCPECSGTAPRAMAMPRLSTMNGTLRKALPFRRHRFRPKVVKREHLAGCGCSLCGTPRTSPPRSSGAGRSAH